jgi:methylglutaconyl-CoA hydratase
LIPATISPYVIRSMGQSVAARYFVTAERFDATEAKAMGLVHTVCTESNLDAHISDLLDAILANAPGAVRACKQLVKDVGGAEITAALRADTARRIADIRASEEGKQGVQSFLTKSTPPWQVKPSK